MTIRRGEIYIASMPPAVGHEQAGRRPVLVIQNDLGNETSNTTIVASLSGRRFVAFYPFHVEVSPKESGLRERSTVLLEQLVTIDIGRLGRRLGRLSPAVMQEVDRALHVSLGLLD